MDDHASARSSRIIVGRTATHLRAALLLLGLSVTLVAAPSVAAPGAAQIGGTAVFDSTGTCGPPPTGYEDFTSYPPTVMMGSLQGCWYTKVESFQDNGAPSGVYLETGREVFAGSLDGGPPGVFATTYRFESRWSPDVSTGSETKGRCQHPISDGSGAGAFAGVSGRVDFKDVISNGTYVYRGHLLLP